MKKQWYESFYLLKEKVKVEDLGLVINKLKLFILILIIRQ
jgi:hypothetical protein